MHGPCRGATGTAGKVHTSTAGESQDRGRRSSPRIFIPVLVRRNLAFERHGQFRGVTGTAGNFHTGTAGKSRDRGPGSSPRICTPVLGRRNFVCERSPNLSRNEGQDADQNISSESAFQKSPRDTKVGRADAGFEATSRGHASSCQRSCPTMIGQPLRVQPQCPHHDQDPDPPLYQTQEVQGVTSPKRRLSQNVSQK